MNCPNLYKSKKKFRMIKGKKHRVITCYAENEYGINLRSYHNYILPLLETLYNSFDTSHSFAYQEGKNCKMLVEMHITSSYFYKIDIMSFFPSINHQCLLSILKANYRNIANKEIQFEELVKSCSSTGTGLDIGMVPSGVLSNIYLAEFDKQIVDKLDKEIIYTRYADDIIISSKNKLDIYYIEHQIINELSKLNLQINPSKKNYVALKKHHDHIKILGLNVIRGNEEHESKNYISVSRKFKNKMYKEKNTKSKLAMAGYVKYNELKR